MTTIALRFHHSTTAEPWRAECPLYGLRSNSQKGATLDLCRQLVALGLPDGPAVAYRDGRPSLLIRSIHEAAGLTIVENDNDGPRFGKYRPTPYAQDADCSAGGGPPMRQTDRAATWVAETAFVDPGALHQTATTTPEHRP